MKRIVITLDLDSKKNPDYHALDELMAEAGFFDVLPGVESRLPYNTYFGESEDGVDIGDLLDCIWTALQEADLHPSALFGGELSLWALRAE